VIVGAPVTGTEAIDGPVVEDDAPLVVAVVGAVVGCGGVVVVVGDGGLVVVVVGSGGIVVVVGCGGVVVVGGGLVVVVVGSGGIVVVVGSVVSAVDALRSVDGEGSEAAGALSAALAASASGPAATTTSTPISAVVRHRTRRARRVVCTNVLPFTPQTCPSAAVVRE
jgi:hypothetical protein